MVGSIGAADSYLQQMQMDGMRPDQARPKGGLFEDLDTDSSGGVSKSEFKTLAQGIAKVTGNGVNVRDTFTAYDKDANGELSGKELFQAMTGLGVQPPPPPPPHPPKFSPAIQGMEQIDSQSQGVNSDGQGRHGMELYKLNSQDITYEKLMEYLRSQSQNELSKSVLSYFSLVALGTGNVLPSVEQPITSLPR